MQEFENNSNPLWFVGGFGCVAVVVNVGIILLIAWGILELLQAYGVL